MAQNSPESLPTVRHWELRPPPPQTSLPMATAAKGRDGPCYARGWSCASRRAPHPPPPPPPPPTSYTYFHSLPINPPYICPYCSPNLTSFPFSFTLPFTPLTLALCHLPSSSSATLPPFRPLLRSFSEAFIFVCGWRSTVLLLLLLRLLHGWEDFHLKQKGAISTVNWPNGWMEAPCDRLTLLRKAERRFDIGKPSSKMSAGFIIFKTSKIILMPHKLKCYHNNFSEKAKV